MLKNMTTKTTFFSTVALAGALVFTAPLNKTTAVAANPKVTLMTAEIIQIKNTAHFQKLRNDSNYCLKSALSDDGDIPRTLFANFPPDLKTIKCVKTKKETFIHVLLPMVLHANEAIEAERAKVIALQKKGDSLSAQETAWLKSTCEKYKVKEGDFDELLKRVDIIPPSLALGQASIESGWGISYAALKKHSPFGMTMVVSEDVKPYQTLSDSVAGYMRNLNSNHAYRKMRDTRAQLRKAGKDVDGHTLIGDLWHYSEERNRYIAKVRSSINKNKLHLYDQVSLKT